jgi:hypothetical protein
VIESEVEATPARPLWERTRRSPHSPGVAGRDDTSSGSLRGPGRRQAGPLLRLAMFPHRRRDVAGATLQPHRLKQPPQASGRALIWPQIADSRNAHQRPSYKGGIGTRIPRQPRLSCRAMKTRAKAALERTMRKLLVVSSALAIVATFVAPAVGASGKSTQTRAQKREQCITEAKSVSGMERGRGFRTHYRACMVRR